MGGEDATLKRAIQCCGCGGADFEGGTKHLRLQLLDDSTWENGTLGKDGAPTLLFSDSVLLYASRVTSAGGKQRLLIACARLSSSCIFSVLLF